MAMGGDAVGEVKITPNVLSEFCNKQGLKVNLGKTDIMVSRNGGYLTMV